MPEWLLPPGLSRYWDYLRAARAALREPFFGSLQPQQSNPKLLGSARRAPKIVFSNSLSYLLYWQRGSSLAKQN